MFTVKNAWLCFPGYCTKSATAGRENHMKNEQLLQKAEEGGEEFSQLMGEHLGLVSSPVQQL